MKTPSIQDLKNRYPGIKPFAEEDNLLFFGRNKVLEELNSRLFVKQTVVLYGKSGYGKSSLINAGIIPRLRKKNQWVYFSIRFNNYSEKENINNTLPVKAVRKRFAEDITIDTDSDFYNIIPDEGSFWYWIKQNQLVNNKARFIIFFDQFEELFTYPKEAIADFSEELSQLLSGEIPFAFREKIDELDQAGSFTDELHEFIYKNKPEIKIVFSIRGDRLSLMNALTDRNPTILQHYYELDTLTADDARLAITEPAKLDDPEYKTSPFTYTDDAISLILKSIANPTDGKIETSSLQIVCRYVEDNLVAEKKHHVISKDILGNITDIFQQYYEATLKKLPAGDRLNAQHLIEDELIDGDRRNSLTVGFIEKRLQIPLSLLSILEQSSLLRKERDASGRVLYEISHDSLISAINKVAEKRRKAEEEAKKEELQISLDKERREKEALSRLNMRFKFAAWFAVAMLLFATLAAVRFWQEKKKALEQQRIAIGKTKESEKQEVKAQIALYENNLLKAEDLITKAKTFNESDDNDYARLYINKASKLLVPKIKLPDSTRNHWQRIRNEMDSLSVKCNEKK